MTARIFFLACAACALSVSGLHALQNPAAVNAPPADSLAEAVKAAGELPRLYCLLVSRHGDIVSIACMASASAG